MRRIFPALVVTSCLLVGLPVIAWAQTNSGFSLTWGEGPSGQQQLRYVLDYGTPGHRNDRYRLKLGSQNVAISGITITYPSNYSGSFNPQGIELRTGAKNKLLGSTRGTVVPAAVELDPENQVIQIVPSDPIPAGTPVEVVLANVKNPSSGGIFYFNCRIASPGDLPLNRYIGTWILSIFRS